METTPTNPTPAAPSNGPFDADVRHELDMVRLLIEDAVRSVIVFVRYRRVAEREAAVRYLHERLEVPAHAFTFTKDRLNPIPTLHRFDTERVVLHLYDVEAALPRVAGVLNLKREAFAEVPHTVVVWVGDHGLRELARHAPDFFAWRSGVFDVRTDAPETTQHMTQVAATESLRYTTRGDLERRASFYASIIEEHTAQDDPDAAFLARMNRRLASVLLMVRRFDEAGDAAKSALEWAKEANRDDERAVALFYVARVAQERRDFEDAERWYRKSLAIFEQQGDEHGVAGAHHNLGVIAQERREFDEAENLYRESLEAERQDNEHGAAITYHQLGRIAEERRDFEDAERWYRKSLEIAERQGDEHGAASTYHQLGMIAQERRDFEEAKRWYRKSLEIEERQGNEHGVAHTYHQLGMIAQERREFEEAERWYHKSSEVREFQKDNHAAANTHAQLGIVAALQGNYADAVDWLTQSVKAFVRTDDLAGARRNTRNFLTLIDQAPASERPRLKHQWLDAGLPPVWEEEPASDKA